MPFQVTQGEGGGRQRAQEASVPAFVGALEPQMWGVAGQPEKMGGTSDRAHLDLLLGTCGCVI